MGRIGALISDKESVNKRYSNNLLGLDKFLRNNIKKNQQFESKGKSIL
jgi:hypothetical protein